MMVARAPAAWRFLRGDFGEGVGAVGFDAVGEEKSLLGEVAFDLGAQRVPGAAEHDVESSGGGGDDDQENGRSLKKMRFFTVSGGRRSGTLISEAPTGAEA